MADIHLDAGDARRTVDAASGDTLVVTLPESPSTGQNWSARSSDAAVLRPHGESFARSGPLMPGAAGTRQFRFLAAGAGTATLACTRAFAATGTTTEEFSIEVVVR
jgi:inhibitor of cysteine peptidase